jgi:hypothetical protein
MSQGTKKIENDLVRCWSRVGALESRLMRALCRLFCLADVTAARLRTLDPATK